MAERDWTNAGHGWQGKETKLRLVGWMWIGVEN
jgi:hypothetical protein